MLDDHLVSKKLQGRVAVVTGGIGTLGSEYVKTLIANGAKVVVFDVRSVPRLISNKKSLMYIKVDVTDEQEVSVAVKQIAKRFDVPTILINNAGLPTNPVQSDKDDGTYENYSLESWNAMLNSHLTGAHLVSQSFIREFVRAGKESGSIINISSTYGLVSPDHSMYEKNYLKDPAYSVAKAGMVGFTKWLAVYCGRRSIPIRVNVLAPGGVFANQDASFVKEYEKRTPMGRMADRGDYNCAILFLASEDSAYMTGSTLVVDGGWTAI